MDTNIKQNTDKEIWRQPTTSYSDGGSDSGMEPHVFVTQGGGIGFNHYGTCVVRTIEEWVKISMETKQLKEKIKPNEGIQTSDFVTMGEKMETNNEKDKRQQKLESLVQGWCCRFCGHNNKIRRHGAVPANCWACEKSYADDGARMQNETWAKAIRKQAIRDAIAALELVPYNLDRNKADGPQHYDMAAGYDDAVLNLKFKIAALKEREGIK